MTDSKREEATQLLAEAILTNQEYKLQLQQRNKTLTKGSDKPVLVCGYDEKGNWRRFLAHLESDAEAAKCWVRLAKNLWTFRGKLKAGTLIQIQNSEALRSNGLLKHTIPMALKQTNPRNMRRHAHAQQNAKR